MCALKYICLLELMPRKANYDERQIRCWNMISSPWTTTILNTFERLKRYDIICIDDSWYSEDLTAGHLFQNIKTFYYMTFTSQVLGVIFVFSLQPDLKTAEK